ncbi:MAG: Peptidase [Candidatus Adlerbacteria bacterium]|nr:Peptidase [Candidatus Adlerbacteria bacterium]
MRFSGPANRIVIPVQITNDSGTSKVYPALVDTGATHTFVSAELVQEMSLQSVGLTESSTAAGKVSDVPVFVIEELSMCDGRVKFPKLRVIQANLTDQPDFEVIVGMDILTQGDFALTNKGGKTVASFRIPSVHEFDFIGEVENWNRFEEEKAKRAINRAANPRKSKKGRR